MKSASVKNPVAVAILNFILPGAGYLYGGVKKTFAWLLLAAFLVYIIIFIDPQSIYYLGRSDAPTMSLWEIISALLLSSAFAYDGYQETK